MQPSLPERYRGALLGLACGDAECKFSASGVAGGSVYPLIYNNCITSVTKTRTEALKQYLKCEEGDMSCPVPGA